MVYAGIRRKLCGRVLDVEGRDGRVEHGEVDGDRYRSTTLSLVTRPSPRVKTHTSMVVAEHTHVWWLWSGEVDIGLRGGSRDAHGGRDRRRSGHRVHFKRTVSVLESIQRNQLGKLATQNLGVSSKMMDEHLRCLLIFGEITTLIEAAGAGRIHEKVGRPVEFNDQAAGSRRDAAVARIGLSRLQTDAFDKGKGEFDLVACGIIIDVICDAGFVGRIKDDEIHGILSDATPTADTQ